MFDDKYNLNTKEKINAFIDEMKSSNTKIYINNENPDAYTKRLAEKLTSLGLDPYKKVDIPADERWEDNWEDEDDDGATFGNF